MRIMPYYTIMSISTFSIFRTLPTICQVSSPQEDRLPTNHIDKHFIVLIYRHSNLPFISSRHSNLPFISSSFRKANT